MLRDDSVNRRLKELLKRRKLRQVDVARACGMGYQSLHRAVNGRRPIYADELIPLARALGTNVERLLGLENPQQ